jgi:hypothetical protein
LRLRKCYFSNSDKIMIQCENYFQGCQKAG